MNFPFALMTALLVSMALIPLLMRLAPHIGMVDMPDPRKVHSRPVPRVGGIGIVLGSLVAILVWGSLPGWMPAYLVGSVVLLLFGAWDDSHEIGHYVKFVGQFAAAMLVVYWGGLSVAHFPFIDDALPAAIGQLFTVIALVGVINAMNHSDGLDGLAGGESLMSLGCMAYLAYLAGGTDLVIVAGAVIGGVFGFLRFNTHPARVFMGDSGSQFLGFTVGTLAILLTQQVNPSLSMAIPLLIIGLPIVDILAVLAQRVHQRMNWFRATRNHVHHRLLDLGFGHYETVVIIYAVQAVLVVFAILCRYESDTMVLGLYAAVCALLFFCLATAEGRNWQAQHGLMRRTTPGMLERFAARENLARWPLGFIGLAIPAYFLVASIALKQIPYDCGVAGVLSAVLILAGFLLSRTTPHALTLIRLGVFSAAGLLVYLTEAGAGAAGGFIADLQVGFFVLLALAIGLTIRLSREDEFYTTPLDYLLIGIVLVGSALAQELENGLDVAAVIVKLIVLLYGSELLINRVGQKSGPLSLAAFVASFGITAR